MSPAVRQLPKYLKGFIASQDYDAYTSQQHATWRYIMRQLRDFFKDHAVDVYLEGLEKTGIPIDRIPRIEEMDDKLSKFGWGAVGVCGFVPPAIFLDFQARSILPIATDMRTIQHLCYTPAPDIVHEAAGHAPIIADPAYRHYLNCYASMAKKAIISQQDIDLYEAIRYLSDIKENPDTTPDQIKQAEHQLANTVAKGTEPSEAALVARMNWWTAEYGLVGNLANPKIYGAGLLSSVQESRNCLSPKVKKIPLTIDCIHQSYDITEPQPQLFVAKSLEILPEVLEQLDSTLAYRTGGIESLKKALAAKTLTTVELDSSIQVSGILTCFESTDKKHADFIKFAGPSQLAIEECQLPGHGADYHVHGFSSPVGLWQSPIKKLPYLYSDADLNAIILQKSATCSLLFQSGFHVHGYIKDWLRNDGKLVLITWENCTVKKGDKIYYQPEWGSFDMIVGVEIPSVFGGPADRSDFGDYNVGQITSAPGRKSPYTQKELQIFDLYSQLRTLRGHKSDHGLETDLQKIATKVIKHFATEWLLGLEVIEIAQQKLALNYKQCNWLNELITAIQAQQTDAEQLIEEGLRLAVIKHYN